jgi:hypothetical protein
MAHISGKHGADGRLVIVNEVTWEVEHNEWMEEDLINGYNVEVSGGPKLVFFEKDDGELEAYSNVKYSGSPPKFLSSILSLNSSLGTNYPPSVVYFDRIKRVLACYNDSSNISYRLLNTKDDTLQASSQVSIISSNNANHDSCIIDPVSDHLLVVYSDTTDSNKGKCLVSEIYLSSNVNGNPVLFTNSQINELRTISIPNLGLVAFVFRDSSNYTYMTLGRVVWGEYLGQNQWYVDMYNESYLISNKNCRYVNVCNVSGTNKIVITYQDNTTKYVEYRVCTFNGGDSVSLGDIGVITGSSSNNHSIVYDSYNEKFVLVYNNGTTYKVEAVFGSISSNSIIDVTTPVIVSNDGYIALSVFDTNSNKICIFYYDYGVNSALLVGGSINENLLTFGNTKSVTVDSITPIGGCFDTSNKSVVFAYNAAYSRVDSICTRV